MFTLTIGKTHSHERYAAHQTLSCKLEWTNQKHFYCFLLKQVRNNLAAGFPRALDLSPLHKQKSSGSRLHMCCVELALDRLLCTHLGSKGFLRHGFSRSLTQRFRHAGGPQWGRNSCLWLPLPAWYGCAHARGTGPAVGWCLCAPCFKFAIELSSIYFSSITVSYDISKQNQQRARIGKIFARWHLAIAIASIFISLFLF